jgi:hypothetical protein
MNDKWTDLCENRLSANPLDKHFLRDKRGETGLGAAMIANEEANESGYTAVLQKSIHEQIRQFFLFERQVDGFVRELTLQNEARDARQRVRQRVCAAVISASLCFFQERCPPGQMSSVERLKAKVEPLFTSVVVEIALSRGGSRSARVLGVFHSHSTEGVRE